MDLGPDISLVKQFTFYPEVLFETGYTVCNFWSKNQLTLVAYKFQCRYVERYTGLNGQTVNILFCPPERSQ
jgi:hypothetical protein